MKLTLWDRLLKPFAPQVVAKNRQARAWLEMQLQESASLVSIAADASNSSNGISRFNQFWRPRARNAVADTLPHLTLQRGQSRELSRLHPIACGAINTNVDRIVGTGLALAAQPDIRILQWKPDQVDSFRRLVQTEFALWSDSTDCDWAGVQNFYEKQDLTLRAVLESGDCFTLLPDAVDAQSSYKLRIQTLEADRIGNPLGQLDNDSVAGGVRTVNGVREFFVYKYHPGAHFFAAGDRFAGQWIRAKGSSGRHRMLHHFRPLRPDQPRGVPYLAPIIDLIKQLGRYTEAEITAAVISSYVTLILEAPIQHGSGINGAANDEPFATPDDELQMAAGAVLRTSPGEKVVISNPMRPNPNFEPFIAAIVKQIGVALSLPFELLIKQFNSSYSASRAALLDAWVYFRSRRTWLARSFCQPIYETWFAEAVMLGRIKAPGFFSDPLLRFAYTRAEWIGDSMGSLSPKDEIAAYTNAVDARLMTREKAQWELFGTDWNADLETKAREQDLLRTKNLLPVPKAGAAAPTETSTKTNPITHSIAIESEANSSSTV